MPKLVFDSKFEKDDIVYFMFEGGMVQGAIRNISIFNAYGMPGAAHDPRCDHRKAEDLLAEIGDEFYDITKPVFDYTVELNHPVVSMAYPGVPYHVRVVGSTRMFRKPEALLEYLKRKFEKAYETKINLEVKRSED